MISKQEYVELHGEVSDEDWKEHCKRMEFLEVEVGKDWYPTDGENILLYVPQNLRDEFKKELK